MLSLILRVLLIKSNEAHMSSIMYKRIRYPHLHKKYIKIYHIFHHHGYCDGGPAGWQAALDKRWQEALIKALQAFGVKPKHWTNGSCDLMMDDWCKMYGIITTCCATYVLRHMPLSRARSHIQSSVHRHHNQLSNFIVTHSFIFYFVICPVWLHYLKHGDNNMHMEHWPRLLEVWNG